MLQPRFLLLALSTGLTGAGTQAASIQDYPSKRIRLMTAQVGGNQDFGARLIAQEISPALGQQVIVENRSGGTLGGEIVAKAPPDGHTLLYSGTIFWTLPLMRKHPPYDVPRDFAPITTATEAPLLLVVHPSLPVKSVNELIGLAKARPGELNYATGGPGSANHLAVELFKSLAGVNITTIQYRGSGGGVIGLMGGEVQMMITSPGSVAPHLKSGRLRAIAVTSSKPTALAPGLPTVAAAGVPGYEAVQRAGMFAPAQTPIAIIDRLNREVVRALNQPDVKEKFFGEGAETIGSSPEALAALVRSEIIRMGKVIQEAGIVAE